MALPVTIPNQFANATSSIPLSQLDGNFSTLANAVNGINSGSETLANLVATTANVTTGNIVTVNSTTVDTTNIEVTNIKAKDGTASATIADSTGVMTIGSSVLTTTDINGGTLDNVVIGGATANAATFTSITDSGNLTFTGTGNRITGDFSNATNASRVSFQTSSSNSNTTLNILPTGTGAGSFHRYFTSGTDPENSGVLEIGIAGGASVSRISSTVTGGFSYFPLTFQTGGSERMRIDTSGNVGIGTSSPSSLGKLVVVGGSIVANGGGTGDPEFRLSGASGGVTRNYAMGTDGTQKLYWYDYTANAYRMVIDSSGNVGIGTTSPNKKLEVYLNSATAVNAIFGSASGAISTLTFSDLGGLQGYTSTAAAATKNIVLQPAGGEVLVAGTTDNGAYNLQCNGTGVWGAGAYVNGSDERIKEDIEPIASGLDVVEKLNPVTYRYKENWSKDQSVQTGFIAQELLTALDGQVYVDGVVQQGGSEGYYSVAYQNIIPILTKAIQELSAKNDALEARIATLEAQA